MTVDDATANETGGAGIKSFDLPLVEGVVVTDTGRVPNVEIPTAQTLERLHEQAYAEGFAQGVADGMAGGEATVAEQIAYLESILVSLTEPLNELDEAVVGSIASLSRLIAERVVRREIEIAPEAVVEIVRETVEMLPVASRDAQIRLHPDDIDVIQQNAINDEVHRGWRLIADHSLSRGGCVVETDISRIDASVESRITAAVEQMLGQGSQPDDAS